MTKRAPTLLLAATALLTQPLAPPAQASPIAYGCGFVAIRELTDDQGRHTWIEATYSYFVGPPDTVEFEITCWLQKTADIIGPEGEVPNTRHTCPGAAPETARVCLNPVIYEVRPSEYVYFCKHVEWVSAITVDDTDAGDIVDHLLQGIFSTGGVTTVGGVLGLVAAVVGAVDALVETDPWDVITITPTQVVHTVTHDYDDGRPGIQCATVNHLEHVAVWSTVDL